MIAKKWKIGANKWPCRREEIMQMVERLCANDLLTRSGFFSGPQLIVQGSNRSGIESPTGLGN